MYFFHVLSEDTTERLSLCFTPSFYVLIHNEAEPFLKTKQSQKSQPLFAWQVLQYFNHLCSPSLDSLGICKN